MLFRDISATIGTKSPRLKAPAPIPSTSSSSAPACSADTPPKSFIGEVRARRSGRCSSMRVHSCCSLTSRISRNSSADRWAVHAICGPATIRAERKISSGACPGSATKPFRALLIASARCCGGGWSTELTPADLGNWPAGIATYLNSASGYASTEAEIGTATTTDFVRQTALFNALLNGLRAALPLSGGSRPRPCLRAARPQDGGFTSRSPRQMWRDRIPKS
jgi:hypothetical protein